MDSILVLFLCLPFKLYLPCTVVFKVRSEVFQITANLKLKSK